MKELIRKLLREALESSSIGYYEKYFARFIPKLEKLYKIKVSKLLGESVGIAYLTNNNRILKITPSNSEVSISLALQETPSKFFPRIFEIDKVTDKWYAILKEFIPELNEGQKKQYLELETLLNEYFDVEPNDIEIMSHLLLDSKNSLFMDYLEDDKPYLVKMYTDLINIMDYAKYVNNNALDIHVDNLGYNGKNLVLFDY